MNVYCHRITIQPEGRRTRFSYEIYRNGRVFGVMTGFATHALAHAAASARIDQLARAEDAQQDAA
jgi:hypothetical protein